MKLSQRRITVGMPVYNSGSLVHQAIESVLNQDHENFELIISDDASTDSTLEICRKYAAYDSRIRLIETHQNNGPLANFQRVLEAGNTEYFMWAAHDDYRDRNYVSALLETLSASEHAELCCARYVKVTPAGQSISVHPYKVSGTASTEKIISQITGAGAPWAYGLYRSAALRPIFARVRRVGVVWFWDFLLLWEFILRQAITGTNDTTIYQVKTGISARLFKPKSFGASARFTLTVLLPLLETLGRAPLRIQQKLSLLPYIRIYLLQHLFNKRRPNSSRLVEVKKRGETIES